MRFAITTAALLALCACKAEQKPAEDRQGGSPSAAAEDPAEKVEVPKQLLRPAVSVEMNSHFAHARALEQAVVDGDLETATNEARALVDELPGARVPEAWQPPLARMQAAATEVTEAEDLIAAATATARVVDACGACHAAVGASVELPEPPPVPEGEDTHARMQRHQWAAERMREGMILPSRERWLLGANAVSVAPPEPCPIEDAEILPDDVLKLREKIYEIGAEAAKADEDQRAAIYGEYLTTCAGCHVGGC